MTEQEFRDLITSNTAQDVLARLAAMPEKERRRFSATARAAYKAHDSARWSSMSTGTPIPEHLAKEDDALSVAVLATGVPSEFVKDRWLVIPRRPSLVEVFRALKPSWIDRWAEATVEDNPHMFDTVQEVHHAGLCQLPRTDAYILGYYVHQTTIPARGREAFLSTDVWRFFEVEGGGEFSLAAHDKYSSPATAWSNVLLKLCEKGELDRDRLLDASLDALERDFGQFRAGWYSRFHTDLAPTDDEANARVGRYLDLLSSTVPPTVSFALKALKRIDKAGGLEPEALLARIEPALQARQKSSAVAALQLLASAAKKSPELSAEIARAAVVAMISEAADVQERALDMIEKLGQAQTPDIREALEGYLDVAAPTVRVRLTDLLGAQASLSEPGPDAGRAWPVPVLAPIDPVGSAEEAVSVFLELLEDCRDPFLIERAMDGMARYGATAQALTSPLAKRARQIRKRAVEDAYSPGKYFERPISVTALAWANGTEIDTELQPFFEERYWGHRPVPVDPDSFEGLFTARSRELLGFVQAGVSLPMLSMPTDNRGCLAPEALTARLALYRAAGVAPGPADFRLALMRLAPEGRAEALTGFAPHAEAERALAYALGADIPPEDDAPLWVIAWASTRPLRSDPRIQALVGAAVPGAGVPAVFAFDTGIHRSGGYSWPICALRVTPPIPDKLDRRFGLGLPAMVQHYRLGEAGPSWMVNLNPWIALLRPAQTELFFAAAIFELELDQKLAAHPCLDVLGPFFRPGLEPGPIAHALLAWYLAAADEAVGATTTDALATLIAGGGFDAAAFADASHKLVFGARLPLRRWTKRIGEVAAISADHARAIREGLSLMLVDLPEDLPRDLGGLLELLHDLHVTSGVGVDSPALLQALDGIGTGGKTGKFARLLTGLATVAA